MAKQCPNCQGRRFTLVKKSAGRSALGVALGLLFLRPLAKECFEQYVACADCGRRVGYFVR